MVEVFRHRRQHRRQQQTATKISIMDGRKRDNPRVSLISFRTSREEAEKVREEAKKKGLSMSQYLNDKLTK
jgi:hypothetical protein